MRSRRERCLPWDAEPRPNDLGQPVHRPGRGSSVIVRSRSRPSARLGSVLSASSGWTEELGRVGLTS